mmetsp:Transcript_28980/g.68076  ORF Transcript_28980/g.68076 Transcript_28980/m.68076 type:complete len:137 (-) Transcript_28980:1315-1725(-)
MEETWCVRLGFSIQFNSIQFVSLVLSDATHPFPGFLVARARGTEWFVISYQPIWMGTASECKSNQINSSVECTDTAAKRSVVGCLLRILLSLEQQAFGKSAMHCSYHQDPDAPIAAAAAAAESIGGSSAPAGGIAT